jgi:hypothetical protein
MGRTRIALLFNEENDKQREVCEYLKSQPRSKTALVTELVYRWLQMQEQPEADRKISPVGGNAVPDMNTLKADITRELLQDRVFIEKVMACVKEQMESGNDGETEKAGNDILGQMSPIETDEPSENEESGELMDFDEDMLLNGMAMFEA